MAEVQQRRSDIFWVFLKLGCLGFGGPLAHVALMDEELVRRRRWLDRETFLALNSITQLIPGPNSTELALAIGHRLAGLPGLLLAGVAFIGPAMLSSIALAILYMQYGRLPIMQDLLSWVRPVVLALIVRALIGFGLQLPHRRRVGIGMLLALGAGLLGSNELLVLLLGGVLGAWSFRPKAHVALIVPALALPTLAPVPSVLGLFGVFLKIGSVLFGSGYTLLLYLQADLVERYGWLRQDQLIDAITVGQITPGPLFSSASFIGYILQGWSGALSATLGIFLPAFVFVALGGWLFPRLLRSPWTRPALEGITIASLGLMLLVGWSLAQDTIQNFWQALLAAVSGLILWKTKLDPAWLIAAAVLAGLLGSFLG